MNVTYVEPYFSFLFLSWCLLGSGLDNCVGRVGDEMEKERFNLI